MTIADFIKFARQDLDSIEARLDHASKADGRAREIIVDRMKDEADRLITSAHSISKLIDGREPKPITSPGPTGDQFRSISQVFKTDP